MPSTVFNSQNAHKWLPEFLEQTLVTGYPPTDDWRGELSRDFSIFERGGSANLPVLAAAIWLLVSYGEEKREAVQWWQRYFRRAKGDEGRGFMEHEPFGTNFYTLWVVTAVGCAQAHVELRRDAVQWLLAFWGYVALCTGWGPQTGWKGLCVALAGARSMGHEGNGYIDRWVPAALGFDLIGQLDWVQNIERWMKDRYDVDLYGHSALSRPILQRHVAEGDQLAAILPKLNGHYPMVPFRFLRSDRGVASVMERGINTNTAPVYAQVWHADGVREWLTLDAHHRKNVDLGTAHVTSVEEPQQGMFISARNNTWSRSTILSGQLIYDIRTSKERGIEVLYDIRGSIPPPLAPPVEEEPEAGEVVLTRLKYERILSALVGAQALLESADE